MVKFGFIYQSLSRNMQLHTICCFAPMPVYLLYRCHPLLRTRKFEYFCFAEEHLQSVAHLGLMAGAIVLQRLLALMYFTKHTCSPSTTLCKTQLYIEMLKLSLCCFRKKKVREFALINKNYSCIRNLIKIEDI